MKKQKIVFISLIVAVLVLTAVLAYVSLRKKPIHITNDEPAQAPPASPEPPTIETNTQDAGPTFGDASYQRLANRLEKAMKGLGTNETEIFNVFGYIKNTSDFFKLDEAFGKRDGENISEWLQGDLSQYYLDKLNNQLKNKGISASIS